ncbi:transcriptional regulator [Subtercola boreus]|uniref:Transcriptional regulator n=1 Tax=Subtercola boreus TaxID=120213 RepID=A0A3E0VDX8_9MICO|nr:helix-turn-helix transcriptional regulator [Subtercola boreus]RFA08124.1 transcriptional regulator [Subtercola boreus]TQL54989.1 helix-turn-helix protein [Subtercola boreus]
MDTPNDIREFLTTRRARLTPELAGIPDFTTHRRVPGLRREEVALLAGMSVEYYIRLERGTVKGVSEAVLEGLVRALQLDEAERTHLYDLVRTANEGATPRQRASATAPRHISTSVQQLLNAMKDVPAFVQNGRLDVLSSNLLGRALFSEMFEQVQPPNFARYVFLDPRAENFYRDWKSTAAQTVALIRAEAGRSPHSRQLSDLVGELSTRSQPFRILWAAHDVRQHRTGVKNISHPIVGDVDINYEAMQLTSDPGLQLIAYSAPPGSAAADALNVLASWATTFEQRTPSVPPVGAAPTECT